MDHYLLSEQDIKELIWELEDTIYQVSERKRVKDEDDFIAYPIKVVLESHPKLYEYLFNFKNYCLRDSPSNIIKDSIGLSSGEQLLIKIVLDLWDYSGNALLRDTYQLLDPHSFQRVMLAIKLARFGY